LCERAAGGRYYAMIVLELAIEQHDGRNQDDRDNEAD
jgi:hypothetical protein